MTHSFLIFFIDLSLFVVYSVVVFGKDKCFFFVIATNLRNMDFVKETNLFFDEGKVLLF